MATIIFEEKRDKRSFKVEQKNEDSITVKKQKNNKEYEVEVIVFTQSDIDEFKKIQEEIYGVSDHPKQALMQKLLEFLQLSNKE